MMKREEMVFYKNYEPGNTVWVWEDGIKKIKVPKFPEVGHIVSINCKSEASWHGNDDKYKVIGIGNNGRHLKLICIRGSSYVDVQSATVGLAYRKLTRMCVFRSYGEAKLLEQIEMFNS